MSFINKIKDFFYDEEEVEEEIPIKEEKKPKKINIYDIEKEKNKSNEEKEVTERELFKSEKTFNFPMDFGDDDSDFVPVNNIKKEKSVNTNNAVKRVSRTPYSSSKSSKKYSSIKHEPVVHKKEEKKFKPTPVISPIYGVMNKNYVPEDSSEISETKEFNFTNKIDFDTVRAKAYGNVQQADESNKGLFFNLDDKEETKEDIKDEYIEKPYKKDEVVITYDQIPDEEEMEVPKITRSKKNKKLSEKVNEETDDKILEDTKEQDLFNLIDNMYSDTDEEEDDE